MCLTHVKHSQGIDLVRVPGPAGRRGRWSWEEVNDGRPTGSGVNHEGAEDGLTMSGLE